MSQVIKMNTKENQRLEITEEMLQGNVNFTNSEIIYHRIHTHIFMKITGKSSHSLPKNIIHGKL